MGKRGPLPQPEALKVLTGGKRKDRPGLPPDQRPIPERPFPAPDFLRTYARAEWERLEPVLREHGRLREEWLMGFAGYCTAVGDALEANEQYKAATHRLQVQMWAGIERKAWAAAQKFGASFGLDPASHFRLPPVETTKPVRESREERYFFGARSGLDRFRR